MKATIAVIPRAFLVHSVSSAPLLAHTPGSWQQQPEVIRQLQELMREEKLDDALVLSRKNLQTSPNSVYLRGTSQYGLSHFGQTLLVQVGKGECKIIISLGVI